MHFPDHEKISAQIYASIFPCEKEIISLIENDMIFHKLKSDEISNFCKTNNFIELLLAGIAALNSNSCLFGGRDSVNFKIKAKTVNQRIKVICRKLKEV